MKDDIGEGTGGGKEEERRSSSLVLTERWEVDDGHEFTSYWEMHARIIHSRRLQ